MNLENLTAAVCDLAREVGAFILQERANFSSNAVEVKSHNSLVSYVDKTAEQRLVEALTNLLPEAGFIAEEGTSTAVGERFNWIIDPLDGTTNFIHGLPCYSVSLALQDHDEIVLGVVYEINHQECFYTWKGASSYLNGTAIRVAPHEQLQNTLVATGFPYHNFDRLDAYMDFLTYLMRHTRGIRRMGSAAVDLAYVACGRFDAYFEYGLNPWDVAAGAILVENAGGTVHEFNGEDNPIFGDSIVATSTAIQSEFSLQLTKHLSEG